MRDVCEIVRQYRFKDTMAGVVWSAGKHVLDESPTVESRQMLFTFMSALIDGQYDRLGMLRSALFATVEASGPSRPTDADFAAKLDAVRRLTRGGRDLTYIEGRIGPFVLSLMAHQARAKQLNGAAMALVIGVARHNIAALDDSVALGVVRYTCSLCNSLSSPDDIQSCLSVLDWFIRSGAIPVPCLTQTIAVLCRTVNIEVVSQTSWQSMRNLLKSAIGYNVLRTMCLMLEEQPPQRPPTDLLRGAVFFLGMATWGSQRVQSLRHSFTTVLPAFVAVLTSKQLVVAYEVTLSLSRLLKKYGAELDPVEWELALDVLDSLSVYVDGMLDLLPQVRRRSASDVVEEILPPTLSASASTTPASSRPSSPTHLRRKHLSDPAGGHAASANNQSPAAAAAAAAAASGRASQKSSTRDSATLDAATSLPSITSLAAALNQAPSQQQRPGSPPASTHASAPRDETAIAKTSVFFTGKDAVSDARAFFGAVKTCLQLLEMLYLTGRYAGAIQRYFETAERFRHFRSEATMIALLASKVAMLHPAYSSNWLDSTRNMMRLFFDSERRTRIRTKALAILSNVVTATRFLYEREIVAEVVLPSLRSVPDDRDPIVRKMGIEVVIDLATSCNSESFEGLISIIERAALSKEVNADPEELQDYDDDDLLIRDGAAPPPPTQQPSQQAPAHQQLSGVEPSNAVAPEKSSTTSSTITTRPRRPTLRISIGIANLDFDDDDDEDDDEASHASLAVNPSIANRNKLAVGFYGGAESNSLQGTSSSATTSAAPTAAAAALQMPSTATAVVSSPLRNLSHQSSGVLSVAGGSNAAGSNASTVDASHPHPSSGQASTLTSVPFNSAASTLAATGVTTSSTSTKTRPTAPVSSALLAATGAVSIFREALYKQPVAHISRTFQVLLKTLHAHSKVPAVPLQGARVAASQGGAASTASLQISEAIREQLYSCLLSLRADANNFIYLLDDTLPKPSPYAVCHAPDLHPSATSPRTDISPAFQQGPAPGQAQQQQQHPSHPSSQAASAQPKPALSQILLLSPVLTGEHPPLSPTESSQLLSPQHHPHHHHQQQQQSSDGPVVLPMGEVFSLLMEGLVREARHAAYVKILSGLLEMLYNKRIFAAESVDVSVLSTFLLETIRSPNALPLKDLALVERPALAAMHVLTYRVLAALIAYKSKLAKFQRDELVACFERGLSSPWDGVPAQCVYALLLCCLELSYAVPRQLPTVLSRLSQVSSAPRMSIPILEFLSGLVRLPHLCANFIEDDYKYVFAICLKYTETKRYGAHICALAHHIIIAWFLRCRLKDRKRYVPFIVKGLPESSAATTSGTAAGIAAATTTTTTTTTASLQDENVETLLDMLARFAHSNCSSLPAERSAVSRALLADAITRHWLIGHTVMTVCASPTTSWAEVTVRKATGTVSWMLRLQNRQYNNEDNFFASPSVLGIAAQLGYASSGVNTDRLYNSLLTDLYGIAGESDGSMSDWTFAGESQPASPTAPQPHPLLLSNEYQNSSDADLQQNAPLHSLSDDRDRFKYKSVVDVVRHARLALASAAWHVRPRPLATSSLPASLLQPAGTSVAVIPSDNLSHAPASSQPQTILASMSATTAIPALPRVAASPSTSSVSSGTTTPTDAQSAQSSSQHQRLGTLLATYAANTETIAEVKEDDEISLASQHLELLPPVDGATPATTAPVLLVPAETAASSLLPQLDVTASLQDSLEHPPQLPEPSHSLGLSASETIPRPLAGVASSPPQLNLFTMADTPHGERDDSPFLCHQQPWANLGRNSTTSLFQPFSAPETPSEFSSHSFPQLPHIRSSTSLVDDFNELRGSESVPAASFSHESLLPVQSGLSELGDGGFSGNARGSLGGLTSSAPAMALFGSRPIRFGGSQPAMSFAIDGSPISGSGFTGDETAGSSGSGSTHLLSSSLSQRPHIVELLNSLATPTRKSSRHRRHRSLSVSRSSHSRGSSATSPPTDETDDFGVPTRDTSRQLLRNNDGESTDGFQPAPTRSRRKRASVSVSSVGSLEDRASWSGSFALQNPAARDPLHTDSANAALISDAKPSSRRRKSRTKQHGAAPAATLRSRDASVQVPPPSSSSAPRSLRPDPAGSAAVRSNSSGSTGARDTNEQPHEPAKAAKPTGMLIPSSHATPKHDSRVSSTRRSSRKTSRRHRLASSNPETDASVFVLHDHSDDDDEVEDGSSSDDAADHADDMARSNSPSTSVGSRQNVPSSGNLSDSPHSYRLMAADSYGDHDLLGLSHSFGPLSYAAVAGRRDRRTSEAGLANSGGLGLDASSFGTSPTMHNIPLMPYDDDDTVNAADAAPSGPPLPTVSSVTTMTVTSAAAAGSDTAAVSSAVSDAELASVKRTASAAEKDATSSPSTTSSTTSSSGNSATDPAFAQRPSTRLRTISMPATPSVAAAEALAMHVSAPLPSTEISPASLSHAVSTETITSATVRQQQQQQQQQSHQQHPTTAAPATATFLLSRMRRAGSDNKSRSVSVTGTPATGFIGSAHPQAETAGGSSTSSSSAAASSPNVSSTALAVAQPTGPSTAATTAAASVGTTLASAPAPAATSSLVVGTSGQQLPAAGPQAPLTMLRSPLLVGTVPAHAGHPPPAALDLPSVLAGAPAATAAHPLLTTPAALDNLVFPSFIFLQLEPFTSLKDRPQALPAGEAVDRALGVLDRIHPYDMHKIGVVYIARNQPHVEADILSNAFGTQRYRNFLSGLGRLIRLRGADVYTGGLDRSNDIDGEFSYMWQDDLTQLIFHVATLMPNRETDPLRQAKKLHIGNDFITIVYNNSGLPYKFGAVKGQFNYIEVVVEPVDEFTNLVRCMSEPANEDLLPFPDPCLVADSSLGGFVRQMALHANFACLMRLNKPGMEYASNWQERLRQIKRMKDRFGGAAASSASSAGARGATTSNSTSTNTNTNNTATWYSGRPEDFTDFAHG
ncbi:hypothetical protein, variant [Capsaspora owczarzaki ATCC 30864]|nr:hypothetical protein, variant [Capsaspora owczarzaki ATCC 30864]